MSSLRIEEMIQNRKRKKVLKALLLFVQNFWSCLVLLEQLLYVGHKKQSKNICLQPYLREYSVDHLWWLLPSLVARGGEKAVAVEFCMPHLIVIIDRSLVFAGYYCLTSLNQTRLCHRNELRAQFQIRVKLDIWFRYEADSTANTELVWSWKKQNFWLWRFHD